MADLPVTSVLLPDGSGLDLASRLRVRRGGLKVIYLSSDSDAVRVHSGFGREQRFAAKAPKSRGTGRQSGSPVDRGSEGEEVRGMIDLLHIGAGAKRSRSLSLACWTLGLSLALVLAPPARASFVGDYAPINWMLLNTNADGYPVWSEDYLAVTLYGGSNETDEPGTTDLVTTAKGPGLVVFAWSFWCFDWPGYDWAGYLLDEAFVQVSDTHGQSGNISFPVSLGQTFGIRVETLDNWYEPGIFRITEFSAPVSTGTAVPEPATISLAVLALAAAFSRKSRATRRG
jgi:hypothetical protein